MPLTKRIIYDAPSYGHVDVYEESAPKTVLQDTNMAHLLGAINQINYLSSYALEIFDGLVSLADGTKERINQASQRVTTLTKELSELEARITDPSLEHAGGPAARLFLSKRETFIPSVLSKATNCIPIKS